MSSKLIEDNATDVDSQYFGLCAILYVGLFNSSSMVVNNQDRLSMTIRLLTELNDNMYAHAAKKILPLLQRLYKLSAGTSVLLKKYISLEFRCDHVYFRHFLEVLHTKFIDQYLYYSGVSNILTWPEDRDNAYIYKYIKERKKQLLSIDDFVLL